jgi:Zn-dependent protease with chaperone function
MFANLIYFIIALLLYATYQPAKDALHPAGGDVGLVFILLTACYIFVVRLQFSRLEKRVTRIPYGSFDHDFNALANRWAIIAILRFAVDIYILNLPSLTLQVRLLAQVPFLNAVLFISLFAFYLVIIWTVAYGAYQKIYPSTVSRRNYIIGNIAFAVPAVLPWLLLTGVLDLIDLLPFEPLKRFLATTHGEIIYFSIFLLAVAITGPALIRRFWGCKPLEAGFARTRIEMLCRKASMKYANILRWPLFGGQMITAGVMGLVKKFRYILVTDAMLRVLEPEEIDAVIAHEIGHVKHKHLLIYLFFLMGYMLISVALIDIIIAVVMYSDTLYVLIDLSNVDQSSVISILFSLLSIFMFIVYFRYCFGYFLRNFERQADTYVFTLFNSARPLIRTFEKIRLTSGKVSDKPNWHHFSIDERIKYLEKCEADKSWISRHDRKVRKSISLYLVGLMIFGWIGYTLNFGEAGEKFNHHFFEKMIARRLAKTPNDFRLYSALGDLYYRKKMYTEMIQAYERALVLNPNDPQVLNNLAWHYATCEDERLRHPRRALLLASQAIKLLEAPHIIDTLAESYYVNGQFEKAVEMGYKALTLAKDNREYYEKQLKKFLKASGKLGNHPESPIVG